MNAAPPRDMSASWCLAAALGLMAFPQLLPIDFDRTGALFLLLPFLWSGRSLLGPAIGRISQGRWWLGASLVVFVATVVGAVIFADQFAPAVTTAASWGVLGSTALIVSELMRREPAAGPRLLGAIALGAALGTLAMWILWLSGGRSAVPLYAHHRIFGMHMLAGSLAAISSVVYFWNQKSSRTVWLVIGAINWGGLLWSGSRGAALALSLALFAWWLSGDHFLRRRLACGAGLLLAAGLLLSLAMWSPRPELGWWNAIRRTAATIDGHGPSISAITSTRSDFWRASLEHATLRPWLGHGPDAYRFLTPKLDGQQPHNLILQLLLDVGAIGTVAGLLFIGSVVVFSWQKTAASRGRNETAPWLILVLASLIASMLDGVFYHLLAFLPATIALGAISSTDMPDAASGGRRWRTITGNCVLIAAMAALALHTWVFYSLAVALPPPASTAWSARIVRAFPTTTYALSRWLSSWQTTEPDAALEWSRWAQWHSSNAPYFHIYAANLLLARGDQDGAEKELHAALAKAHWLNKPAIEEMLHRVESSRR